MKPFWKNLLIYSFCFGVTILAFIISQPTGTFQQAEKMKKLGRYASASQLYEKFANNFPGSDQAPESYFKAARLYHQRFRNIDKARELYQKVIDFYPKSQWSKQSQKTLELFPEYFPSYFTSNWVYGDSESGGTHIKIVEQAHLDLATQTTLNSTRTLYAGTEKISKFKIKYFLKEKSVRMQFSTDKKDTLLLKYPIKKNKSWDSIYLNKKNKFKIVETGLTVSVRAGTFYNCIKVKRHPEQTSNSWVYDYYAPFVGLILNSNATLKKETRITELLSFSNQ